MYINNIFYSLTLPTVKLSLLCMYWKIFGRVKAFHYATIVVGMIVIGWMIGTLFAQVFTCIPVQGAWEPEIGARCIDQVKFYYGNAISNVITDVIILVMPLHLVWHLQMSVQRKIGLSLVILLGSLWVLAPASGNLTADILQRLRQQHSPHRYFLRNQRRHNL